MAMLKKLATIAVINAVIAGLFVLTSYNLAAEFNGYPQDLLSVHWDFFGWITVNHAGSLVNGDFMPVGATSLHLDFPFWLFFVSTAVNLSFIVKLLKDQETKKQ